MKENKFIRLNNSTDKSEINIPASGDSKGILKVWDVLTGLEAGVPLSLMEKS